MEAQDGPRAYYLPLAIKTISLIAIYATYGVLQERIIKGHYDSVNTAILNNEESQPPNDSFTSAPFLVLCNRLVSLVTGIVLAQIQFAKAQYAELPSSSSSTPCRAQSWREAISEQLTRMRPSSNFLSYAIVAGLNNAATLAQYSSLAYLSFTTSTLGKSAKMVPVLIIGHLWYGKRYKTRQWVGVAIVILGIWGYLTSLMGVDDTDKKKQEMAPSTNVIGIACLLAYLFFDGLTSTMQERLFGQAKNREETSRMLGITPGIVDQMIWVNAFSTLIALWLLLLSPPIPTLTSLSLALTTPLLQLHILLLSLTATAGLLLLFHVIATYGALIASLIMTVRQFVSIVCNAAWFGHVASTPLAGWAGIGLMAAGVWIKMDRRYDLVQVASPPTAPNPTVGRQSSKVKSGRDFDAEAETWSSAGGGRKMTRARSLLWQYGVPLCACPTIFVVLVATIEFLRGPAAGVGDAIWGIGS